MKSTVAIITLAVVGLLIGRDVQSAMGEKGEIKERKALVVVSGVDSRVTKPSIERIEAAKDWAKAWARHLGTTEDDPYRPAFEVDFDHCIVVAIFRGDRVNRRGMEVEPIAESKDEIRIRFADLGYQTVGEGKSSNPYAFVVIPKTAKTIALEENVQNIIGQPPVWEECGKLLHRAAK